jgi:hypothetical protein
VDKNTGLVMQDISTVAHKLDIDDYFLPDLKIRPTISKVTTNITVDTSLFVNQIYPVNGTVEHTTGYETVIVKTNVPSVALIISLAIVIIISLTAALVFYCQDKAEGIEAMHKELVYGTLASDPDAILGKDDLLDMEGLQREEYKMPEFKEELPIEEVKEAPKFGGITTLSLGACEALEE